MTGWRRTLSQIGDDAEGLFAALKRRLDERLGRDALQLVSYRGYGSTALWTLKGRVLEDRSIRPAEDTDTVWRNLDNMYRRFASNEIPGAQVQARLGDHVQEATTDREGYFEFDLAAPTALPAGQFWHEVTLSLLHPQRAGRPPLEARGQVLVPPPDAQFGVISDIDDTVLQTDATNALRMARLTFLGNARTRLPFPGVAALYRALHQGAPGPFINPIFYVSSGPWNMYDLLIDFFALQGLPDGPVLLRDWGMLRPETRPTQHRAHKLATITQLLARFPQLPFLLIGDSGQADPEIYAKVVQQYPQRVLAVYIRNVSPDARRAQAIQTLADAVAAAGSRLLLADDTLSLARDAAAQGWIAAEALDAVAVDKAADEGPATPFETSLDDGDGG